MSEVVALLLDDAMPPERLGALLLAARKRRGLKRRQAAAAAGTTAAKLRAYERGDEPVPAGVCAQLAECYGDDLTAHVPLRVPMQVESERLVIGDVQQPVGPDDDDVIAGYIDIVQRLRNTGPGDPLALRTVDIVALAGALGRDRDAIELRIAEALGCTRVEARRLHGELLRRKVILPVAGLAAGMAAFAGSAAAVQSASSSATNIETRPVVATAPSTTSPTQPAPTTAKPVPVATTTTTTTTTTTAAKPAPAPAPAVDTTAPTSAGHQTDATVPPSEQTADVPISVASPKPDPDDPPVSVLPGETPITVIGTPDSTSQTP
jgi:transcriptional regulator with XRE-family HTH domain